MVIPAACVGGHGQPRGLPLRGRAARRPEPYVRTVREKPFDKLKANGLVAGYLEHDES